MIQPYRFVSLTFPLLMGLASPLALEAETNAELLPLVYQKEHTGAAFEPPPLPPLETLPTIYPLTDPFAWSDGRGRSTDPKDWSQRRAEIQAEIEHYEIGTKPGRPEDLLALYDGEELIVEITVGNETLALTATVTLPEGPGPFPAIIGIGWGTGSLPADIFTDRGVAQIAYNFSQVMAHTQTRGQEPINKLYPGLTHMGAYSAWSWGISRLIDGLEEVQDALPIDLQRIGITGCSFAGKMALFAGAFDERIALTIAQEPGGGGAAAWRVSETLGNVEKLGATSRAWFIESMFQFSGGNVFKLPMDHHELMAMVAPRALLVLGNPDYQWLAEPSGYVSCRAAHEVWATLGIGDRMGFSFVAGHPHCRIPDSQRPEIEAFVDKFLLGDSSANTEVAVHPYPDTDYQRWIGWWGHEEPTFPGTEDAVTIALEAESGTPGAQWIRRTDEGASNGAYLTQTDGLLNADGPPADTDQHLIIPFDVPEAGNYTLFARLDCPTADDDSLWLRLDDGDFQMRNGLGTNGWQWITLDQLALEAGAHTLTLAIREDGVKVDKLTLSTFFLPPEGKGDTAVDLGD